MYFYLKRNKNAPYFYNWANIFKEVFASIEFIPIFVTVTKKHYYSKFIYLIKREYL